MAQDSQFEKWKKALGVESEPVTYEVERGHVKRFAEAIDDPNPLWQDEVEARKSPYGSIIAPPTFTRAFVVRDEEEGLTSEDTDTRVLDAGSEWEYYHPIKVGDRITVTSKLAELYKKEGRLGTMTFHVQETTYKNQFGEVVLKRMDTSITY